MDSGYLFFDGFWIFWFRIADFSNVSKLDATAFKAIGHYYIPLTDKWGMTDLGADFVYTGNQTLDFMLPNGLKQLVNSACWESENTYPLFTCSDYLNASKKHSVANFVRLTYLDFSTDFLQLLKTDKTIVLILDTDNEYAMAEMRRAFYELLENEIWVLKSCDNNNIIKLYDIKKT